MEVLIGLPGCKAISSLGQRVAALNRAIFYFPGGTKGAMLCVDKGTEFKRRYWKKKSIENEIIYFDVSILENF